MMVSEEPTEKVCPYCIGPKRCREHGGDAEVLGVLTGQVPVRSMPVATSHHDHEDQCCREHGFHSTPHKGCILR